MAAAAQAKLPFLVLIVVLTMSSRVTALRVVSYNVLSSHLASPSHFSTLDPTHLEASTRLEKILTKLQGEVDRSADVFCLQEVSYDWAGKFHAWFARRNYHVIAGNYGRPFNGYMGVLTAISNKLALQDVDITRVSDTYDWPEPPTKSLMSTAWESLKSLVGKETPESHWSIAKRRFNVLITVKLETKGGNSVYIGNYHMPCCYYAPKVMTMHADMVLAHLQTLADGSPYVLAGDFNVKPSESVYRFLTTGKIDADDPCYPTPTESWTPTIREAAVSAYKVANGNDPDFTNYARVGENDPFVDVLDYIFVSPKVTVKSVLQLPHRDDTDGPFPSATEPSDHILIAADLQVS